MALTAIGAKNAKPGDKARKLTDEKGLYLLVSQAGKYWRFDYRFGGKRKTLALGVYPEVTLAEAREQRDASRKLMAQDIDPGVHRKTIQNAAKSAAENSFEAVSREWFSKYSPVWAKNHSDKIIRRLELNVFPWHGEQEINTITAPQLLVTLRRIESRGAVETAHRTQQNCSQIFRYAIVTGRAERDPAADLRRALPPVKVKHHPTITDPTAIGGLLRAIDGYEGTLVTKCALQLAPLLFVRPGELRKAEWQEFKLETAEWRIPAIRMKMRQQHIVPLSTQALTILGTIQKLTGNGRYVFPGARSNDRPMSDNAVLAALRRMGYAKDEMTGHGFRSMASTLLNEQGWHRDAIERQLAHSERDSVRAAYNYAEHLPERKKMMQAWADYLDSLR